jgi:glutathione synthase/RimK-type ligase-like ATP-grasp enzyme
MVTFKPMRGKIYQGWPIPKFEELRRLAAAGVPVPRSAILTPDLDLDPSVWGEFVIVKPTDIATSSHGRGIQLMRTRRVRYMRPRDYPAGHPGRLGPMVVQQYIDTGRSVSTYRVLTFFGEPLYAQLNLANADRVELSAPDEVIEGATIALQTAGAREGLLIDEADVLAMARAADAALPEIPLKGVDLLRDVNSGKLYVIELNAGGNTWHFSSTYSAELRRSYGAEYELRRRQQFDGLRAAARVLMQKTNAEAE